MFDQSERFRAALMQTRGITLTHSSGETNPYKTILTAQELCTILTELRENYDKRDKGIARKKRVFVDMDSHKILPQIKCERIFQFYSIELVTFTAHIIIKG